MRENVLWLAPSKRCRSMASKRCRGVVCSTCDAESRAERASCNSHSHILKSYPEGVLVCPKDPHLKKHKQIGVPNIYVMKLMQVQLVRKPVHAFPQWSPSWFPPNTFSLHIRPDPYPLPPVPQVERLRPRNLQLAVDVLFPNQPWHRIPPQSPSHPRRHCP